MPRITPFEKHHERYDAWFSRHEAAYHSELLAVRALLPFEGFGLEIGVGTGRFAAPLGVRVGIDPSGEMLAHAARRGISAVRGVAETLPFRDGIFDYVLAVTTICFVDDARAMMAEVRRVLKEQGKLVVGFIDRESAIGGACLAHQEESTFYREATFFSSPEVERLLEEAGFARRVWAQTLFRPLDGIREIEPIRPGRGEGSFVTVQAARGEV
jgi:SAM-dependent methyltransferase